MTAFNSGPSIKLYRKISNWFNFDKNNVLQVYSGKIDIGQHISSTLALISSKITGINYDQVEIIKLNTDISPNEGKTASSLSVPDSGSAIKAASFTLRKSFLKYSLQTLKVDVDEIIFKKAQNPKKLFSLGLGYHYNEETYEKVIKKIYNLTK